MFGVPSPAVRWEATMIPTDLHFLFMFGDGNQATESWWHPPTGLLENSLLYQQSEGYPDPCYFISSRRDILTLVILFPGLEATKLL